MQRTLLLEMTSGRIRPMRRSAPVWSSASLGGDGFLVEEHEPADSRSDNVALLESVVFLPLDGGLRLDWRSGRQRVTKRIAPGQVSILPANHPYSVHLRAAGPSVVVSLTDRLLAVAAADQGMFSEVHPVWVHGVKDALLRELVMSLRAELRVNGKSGERYARNLASTLAAHIVRRYSTDQPQLPERRGGLTAPALRRVIQYIHDHLEEELTLNRLAEHAGLSTCHFARKFKSSTGLAPPRYLLNCRLARARQLLAQGRHGLAEVALASGFCDQGHLTRCFRQMVGVTPAVFARETRAC